MSFAPESLRFIALATVTLCALVCQPIVISRGKRKHGWIAARIAVSGPEGPRTLPAAQGYDAVALRRMPQLL
jgi:hypothetical protein